jgi:hypothetical protein
MYPDESCANTTPERSPLDKSIAALDDEVSDLNKIVDRLAERLVPVLGRTVAEKGSAGEDVPPEHSSRVVALIDADRHGVRAAVRKLYDILERLVV